MFLWLEKIKEPSIWLDRPRKCSGGIWTRARFLLPVQRKGSCQCLAVTLQGRAASCSAVSILGEALPALPDKEKEQQVVEE